MRRSHQFFIDSLSIFHWSLHFSSITPFFIDHSIFHQPDSMRQLQQCITLPIHFSLITPFLIEHSIFHWSLHFSLTSSTRWLQLCITLPIHFSLITPLFIDHSIIHRSLHFSSITPLFIVHSIFIDHSISSSSSSSGATHFAYLMKHWVIISAVLETADNDRRQTDRKTDRQMPF